MKSSWFLAAMLSLLVVAPIHADVSSFYVQSIEWLTDSSELIVEASVVRRRINNTDQWETRVAKVSRILKSVDGMGALPFSDVSDITVEGTNTVLLFGIRNKDRKSATLMYCVVLNRWAVPEKPVERTRAYQGIHGYTSAGQKESFHNKRCIAVDKEGNILVDPAKVVEAVDRRVKLHPKRFSNAGRYLKRGHLLEDSESDYNVLVPFEPEFKKEFLRDLRNDNGWTRWRAACYLAHYEDPEVIAALKGCLDDSYVSEDKDSPKLTPRYMVRKAAYEGLKSMGVETRRPLLEPPADPKPVP